MIPEFVKITTPNGAYFVCRTAHIVSIDPTPLDTWSESPIKARVLLSNGDKILISQSEADRLTALLTAAPVVQAPHRVDYSIRLAPQDQIPNLLDIVIRMKKASDEFEEQEIYGELLDAIAQSMIPADVVKAYRQLRIDEIRYKNSSMPDEQRRDLIDLLGTYIPEETDHE